MNEDAKNTERKRARGARMDNSGAVYGMGMIAAAVYFIQHASTFGAGAWGLVKAIFWPAVLVYKALEVLKM